MPSPIRLERPPTRLGFVPIFLANLIPLVGVLQLGWDPATLLVIYALELLFTFPLAAGKALFAQQPPWTDREGSTVIGVSSELVEKRGSVELVSWLPPFYPRNLPFATAVVHAATGFVIVIVLSNVFTVAGAITSPEVMVSALALVAGQSIETWRDYRSGGYETASPYAVVETPTRQAFFVAFVLFATPGIAGGGVEVVLAVVVLVKLLVEWSAYRVARSSGGWLAGWLSGPEGADEESDPVCVPGGEPAVRVPTDRRAVLYTGMFHVVGRIAPFAAMPFIVVWFLSMMLLGSEASLVLAIGATFLVFAWFVCYLALKVTTFYLRYGSLEYRRYGDRLVAHDALLNEPQWSSSVEELREVQVVPDRLPDRLLGTRTVAVTTGWDDGDSRRYLGPVDEPDALVAAFELPVRTTVLEPLDGRPAVVVVTCLVGIAVAAVLLAIGPWISPSALLFGVLVYGIPFVALVLGILWQQSYPERSD